MLNLTIATGAFRVGLGALAGIALFAAVPAAAGERPQVLVSYTDLDLTHDAGQATLGKRIQSAVKRVCRDSGDRIGSYEESQCRRASRADALRQMKVAIARADGRKTGIAANLAVAGPTPSLR